MKYFSIIIAVALWVPAFCQIPLDTAVNADTSIVLEKPESFDLLTYKGQLYRQDSIVWRQVQVLFEGDALGEHHFVYSEPYRYTKPEELDPLNSTGYHYDYFDRFRKAICKVCGRHIEQREKWFQSIYEPPKSEYEQTVEQFQHD